MVNIWEFLLQSISVSLVAGFLLIIKAVFKDKLSPRWQYGVWSILALRILLPVRASKFVLLPFGVYLEALKSVVEVGLSSAYTDMYAATQPRHIVPFISGSAKSITDFLFVFYLIGVIAFLSFYFFSYIRLRIALRKGRTVTGEEEKRIRSVFEKNKVRFIRIICVDGINSAFICGVFRPVLVLPSERPTHDDIILHEVMHLKHYDSFQNVFWCILRCLHWCNPFMHYVFNVIGNDMESLCDQRVLEKLEGEERRQYGLLLLNEVNKKYARMPFTTSVSNGGKNISKRIESIVRFKKYPKGMALVSVCIVILLAVPCLFQSASGVDNNEIYYPTNLFEFEKSLAYTKVCRCTTVAGAIDTYAKGLINQNGIMPLTASPTERHEAIMKKMRGFCGYDSGFDAYLSDKTAPFSVFNLIKTDKNRYSALLVFSILEADDTDAYENEEDDEAFRVYGNALIVPIEIRKEKDSWVVVETGERTVSENHLDKSDVLQLNYLGEDLTPLFSHTQKGSRGSLQTVLKTSHSIHYQTSADNQDFFFPSNGGYDNTVYRDAEFSGCLASVSFTYAYDGENFKAVKHVSSEYTRDMDYEFKPVKTSLSGNYASSSSDESGSRSYSVNEYEPWDKTVNDISLNSNFDPEEVMESYNKKYKFAVYLDGVLTDEFLSEVKVNE